MGLSARSSDRHATYQALVTRAAELARAGCIVFSTRRCCSAPPRSMRRVREAKRVDTLYSESAYYRMLFAERTRDLAFYLDATHGADSVLELGVGTGRIATALAAQGRRVLGV